MKKQILKQPETMNLARILVAEDDSQTRDLLIDYLEQEGYEVVGVKDGEDALSVIHKQDVELN